MPLALLISAFCVFINIQEFLVQKLGLSALSYVDEAMCLAAYVIVPLYIKKKKEYWIILILLAPVISFIHGLAVNTFIFNADRTTQAAFQSIINFKLLIYFTMFYCAAKAYPKSDIFTKTLAMCLAISLLGYTLNLLWPDFFLFSEEIWHLERNRISGFQFKPNDLAILLGLSLLFLMLTETKIKGKFIFSIFLLSLIAGSSSRTALIFSVVAICMHMALQKQRIAIAASAYIGAILFLIFFETIEKSFFVSETLSNLTQFSAIDQTQYIRAIMIYYGSSIAFYYPAGVGAGNYGSVMSENSPIYEILGLSNMYFFRNMVGIYDSNFAAILGEYGALGLIAFFIITKKILKEVLGEQQHKIIVLASALLILTLTQPVYAYQVNSLNFLLLLFALGESTRKSAMAGVYKIKLTPSPQ